jgi:hypothetical protein
MENNKKNWSEEDVNFLIENYENEHIPELEDID